MSEINDDQFRSLQERYLDPETLLDLDRLGLLLSVFPELVNPMSDISHQLPYDRIKYTTLRARVPCEFSNSYLLRRSEGDICRL